MTATDADIRAIQQAIQKLTRIQREDLAEWILNSADFAEKVGETALPYGEPKHLTVEEYLRLEEESALRHEYIAGQIFAMSSAMLRHEVIVGNLLASFHSQLRGGPCVAFPSNAKVRLRIERDDIFYLPDVMIACGPFTEEALNQRYLTDPCVVIEVLSPSTEVIDRREKAINYRHLSSLEDYVLIAQRSMEVTLFRRTDNWVPQVLAAPEDVLELRSVELNVSLREIYERVR